ncbi:hypothetical protein L7F22_017547 [Adiantum nelumboides]|nr:hypothetical protein [Adiantum nelumboides]MCO5563896.1 hypothetical protein [Adiantum nelumboides]
MFNVHEHQNVAIEMESSLNLGQHDAFNGVLQAVQSNNGAVFFFDGPGRLGKIYVYNALLSWVHGEGKIALACASSGIVALLLSNGRTDRSRFKIPIDVCNTLTCNIKVNSTLAELLRQTSLIVWNEAPMVSKYAFEALERTLRDIMWLDSLSGGKVILMRGDFRQVLPVILKGRQEDIVDESLCNSFNWRKTQVLRFTENMRLVNCGNVQCESNFAKWVLDIDNGNVATHDSSDDIALHIHMLLEESA